MSTHLVLASEHSEHAINERDVTRSEAARLIPLKNIRTESRAATRIKGNRPPSENIKQIIFKQILYLKCEE